MYCLFLRPLQSAWVLMSSDTRTKNCMLCKEEKPELCPMVNGKSVVPVALIHPSAWKMCWDNVTVRYIYLLAFQFCSNAHLALKNFREVCFPEMTLIYFWSSFWVF